MECDVPIRESSGVRVHHEKERWGESSPREKERWGEGSPSEGAMG